MLDAMFHIIGRHGPVACAAAVCLAKQAYTSETGKTVWRYCAEGTFIDRFFGGEWKTYGPY